VESTVSSVADGALPPGWSETQLRALAAIFSTFVPAGLRVARTIHQDSAR
jgi:hypothetical protein